MRHEARFAAHPRMALQVKNLARIAPAERLAIQQRAADVRRADWDFTPKH
jgi:deoxyribodipyrimidine photolyase-related protein